MMAQRGKSDKGYRLEELLRAYFLRAGFFVVRSLPFQHVGEDLTDIDLWLYERPTGSSRRRQIVDAKSRTRPKAVERLLWTNGLVQLLDVDGAYVATTDARPMLRGISKKLGISVLDGADIRRIGESEKVIYPDRITEEEFVSKIASIDKMRRSKDFQLQFHDIKLSLIDNFGAGTINRALDSFDFFCTAAVTAHPDTQAAEVALRLSYFAGAIVALALDYISSEVSFRASEERRAALVNAIRFGDIDEAPGLERMRLAIALLEKYSSSGDTTARAVELAVKRDFKNIPAEIIAEHVVKSTKPEDLFQIAKRLEHLSFSRRLTPFDALGIEDKAFIAILLDYNGIDRNRFASCWSGEVSKHADVEGENTDDGPLFADKRSGSAR
jgi:hypothetical protein